MSTFTIKLWVCREYGTIYAGRYLPAVGNNRRHCPHCRRPLVVLAFVHAQDDDDDPD